MARSTSLALAAALLALAGCADPTAPEADATSLRRPAFDVADTEAVGTEDPATTPPATSTDRGGNLMGSGH